MVGGAVVVDEERHVLRHLADVEIAAEEIHSGAVGVRAAPEGGADEFLAVGQRGFLGLGDVEWPDAGVGAEGVEKTIGAGGGVGDGDAAAGGLAAVAFEFEVEPHHELSGGGVEDHLGAFDDAAALDVVAGLFDDGEGDAAVGPVVEIGGRVNVDADLGGVAVLLVLAEPEVDAFVEEDAATVDVEVIALIVGPGLIGKKTRAR